MFTFNDLLLVFGIYFIIRLMMGGSCCSGGSCSWRSDEEKEK